MPVSVPTVRVTATYRTSDDEVPGGSPTITFTRSHVLFDPDGATTYPLDVVECTIDSEGRLTNDGDPWVDLIPNNHPLLTPTDSWYTVVETFAGQSRSFNIRLDHETGEIDLAQIAEGLPSTGSVTYYYVPRQEFTALEERVDSLEVGGGSGLEVLDGTDTPTDGTGSDTQIHIETDAYIVRKKRPSPASPRWETLLDLPSKTDVSTVATNLTALATELGTFETVSSSGGATAINLESANNLSPVLNAATENTTVTVSGASSTVAPRMVVVQGHDTNSYTYAWPGVTWATTGPTTVAADSVHVLFFWKNAGTVYGARFGVDGADGNQVLTGSGVPSSGTGNDGDLYIDTTAVPPKLYGPKASGSWPGSPVNLGSAGSGAVGVTYTAVFVDDGPTGYGALWDPGDSDNYFEVPTSPNDRDYFVYWIRNTTDGDPDPSSNGWMAPGEQVKTVSS